MTVREGSWAFTAVVSKKHDQDICTIVDVIADEERLAVLQSLTRLAPAATKSEATIGGVSIGLRQLRWGSNKFLDPASLRYLQETVKAKR